MGKRSKAAIRKARYRERLRQPTVPEAAVEKRIAEIRNLLRPDAAADLVRDYAAVGLALDEELARRPRRARAIQELTNAKGRLAEMLQITPQARKASGEEMEMVPLSDVQRSLRNVLRIQRTAWESLKSEIGLFGNKEDIGGQTRALYLGEIATLREKSPSLFDPSELTATPADLYDRIVATAPRLPGEPSPVPAGQTPN